MARSAGSGLGPYVVVGAIGATLMAAPIAAKEATFEPGTPAALFRPRIVKGGSVVLARRHQYDVAPDGRFLINVSTDDTSAAPITIFQNLDPGLPARER